MKNSRYIAYFDILGYKEIVENLALGDIEIMMRELYALLNKTVKSVGICDDTDDIDYIMFSDSIIIYSDDISESSFKKIVYISNALLYISLRQSRPLRGAISHGEFYIDKKRNIFFGKALVNGYLIEAKQKWSGACISKDTIKFINDKYPTCIDFLKNTSKFVLEYDIPMDYKWLNGCKEEDEIALDCVKNHFIYKNIEVKTEKMYALNWSIIEDFSKEKLVEHYLEIAWFFSLSDIKKSENRGVEPKLSNITKQNKNSINFKIINTLNFFNYCRESEVAIGNNIENLIKYNK